MNHHRDPPVANAQTLDGERTIPADDSVARNEFAVTEPNLSRAPWSRRHDRLVATLLFAATCLVYGRVTTFEHVGFDDPTYVLQERHVREGLTGENVRWALTTTHFANWHPLTWISYMADVSWFGGGATAHHATNLLLHAANAALLFLLLRNLTGQPVPSLWTAALFAFHPLHVESFAWISERKDVLSTFFGLLSLLSYTAHARSSSRWWYLTAWLTFVASLASKAMLVTLPCVFLLLDFWPLRRSSWRRCLLEKVPFLAVSLAVGWLAIVAQGRAMPNLENVPLAYRLSNVVVGYTLYLWRTLWPLNLRFLYPLPAEIPIWQVVSCGTLLAVLTGASIVQARRRPYLLVGWLWFLGTLFPVSGLLQAGAQRVADRYTYVPLIGLFLAVVWLVDDLVRGTVPRRLAGTVGSVAIVVLAILGVRQAETWRNSTALFEHGHFNAPPHPRTMAILGNEYASAGRTADGMELLERALKLDPNMPIAHEAIGLVHLAQERHDEAIDALTRALELRPDEARTAANLGLALARAGHADRAVERLEEALEIDPEHGRAWTILSEIHRDAGEEERAEECLTRALRVNPFEPRANRTLALRMVEAGELEAAVEHYRRADVSRPNAEVCCDLGVLLERLARPEEAETQYRRALRLDPELAVAWMNLGNVLAARGALPTAARHYEQALALDPEMQTARDNLALVQRHIRAAHGAGGPAPGSEGG